MEEFGIPHCIGIIDGFHVNLATAEARDDAGAFHSRKERYGYNVLGVVDDTTRFRYLHYGYPASSSDMRVQRAAEPLNHPDEHFSRNEYLLADSGFTASEQMVPMFRKTAGNTIMRGRPAHFNTIAATMRYQVEQAIGILKSRWTILRSLPLRLRTTHDQALAHGIIVACVIFHNLVVNTDDEPLDDDEYTDAEARHSARAGQAQLSADELRVPEHLQRRERLVTEMISIAMENDENLTLDDYEVCSSTSPPNLSSLPDQDSYGTVGPMRRRSIASSRVARYRAFRASLRLSCLLSSCSASWSSS